MFPVVKVEWVDACGDSSGDWEFYSNIEHKWEPNKVVTVGLLLKETPEGKAIGLTAGDEADACISGWIFIPNQYITKVTYLEEKR